MWHNQNISKYYRDGEKTKKQKEEEEEKKEDEDEEENQYQRQPIQAERLTDNEDSV